MSSATRNTLSVRDCRFGPMPENDIDSNGRARAPCQVPNGVLLEVGETNGGLRTGNNGPSFRIADMTCMMRDQGPTHLGFI